MTMRTIRNWVMNEKATAIVQVQDVSQVQDDKGLKVTWQRV